MLKKLALQDEFLFALISYLPFLIFLLVFRFDNIATILFSLSLTLLFAVLCKTKVKKYVCIIYLLIVVILFFSIISHLSDAVNAVFNQITTVYASHSNYVFQVYEIHTTPAQLPFLIMRLLLTLYLVFLLLEYLFIVSWKRHLAAFAMSFLLFFPTILYSVPQPWILTWLLLVGWVLLLLTSYLRRKNTLPWHYGKLFFYVAVCISIVFGATFVMLPVEDYTVSESSNTMRQKLLHTIDELAYNLRYGSQKTGEIDLGRAGNRTYTGAIQMEVNYAPATRLYLKTFSGALYDGHSWTSLDAKSYRKQKAIDWTNIRTWMNQSANKLDFAQTSALSIRDKRADTTYAILPYYLKSVAKDMNIYYDGYATWTEKKQETLQYVVWENKEDYLPVPQGSSYKEYVDFVKATYLQIPKELENKFASAAGLQDNRDDFESVQETINYIKNYLNTNTRYTLSPGNPSHQEDFISYFLWTNQQGYCVHYASSAVMLLRYYGIPARYAEGYRVDASQYDDTGHANVKDADAHAWVEVFDQSYGWIPIEVTPVNDTETQAIASEKPITKNEVTEISDVDEKEEPSEINHQIKQHLIEETGSVKATANTPWLSYLGTLLLLLALPILILLQAYLRRKYRLRKLADCDTRKKLLLLYSWLLDLQPYGSEVDEELIRLAEKARFSQHAIHEDEVAVVHAAWQKQRSLLLSQLSWKKKLKFMLWDAL